MECNEEVKERENHNTWLTETHKQRPTNMATCMASESEVVIRDQRQHVNEEAGNINRGHKKTQELYRQH